MEPEVKAFLLMIVNSIAMCLLWMLLNMTFGIYFNYAFFDNGFAISNVIYYIFLIGSFIFLLIYLRKKWKGFKEIGE